MIATLLLSAALQTPPGDVTLSCALLAPAGEAVAFTALPATSGTVTLIPADGSVWPAARASGRGPARGGGQPGQVVFGGRNGLALDVGRAGPQGSVAMLSRWDGKRATYPVAFGICSPIPSRSRSAVTPDAAIVTQVPAFDPARWPNDCALLLAEGRRMRVDYTLSRSRNVVTLASPELWNGKTVEARFVQNDRGGRFTAGEQGPSGSERLVYDRGSGAGAKLVHFNRMGDPAATGQAGYAICGLSGLVRRPNTQ